MQEATNESLDQAVADGAELRARLAAAEPAEREAILGEAVREVACLVLGQSPFESGSNFLESGLTLILALDLAHRVAAVTGIEVPLVAVIEHPTPADLGRFMAESFAGVAG
jgi:hypothetical protein